MEPGATRVVDPGQRWLIVGAGSAGCVLAARLSEDADRDVTLLEAGPALDPSAVPRGVAGPSFFDALEVAGRSYTDLEASRVEAAPARMYARGRGVGGSSAVNAMLALRGSDEQYRGWGWDDADAMWDRVSIPAEPVDPEDLGPVDRALLSARSDARPALLTRRNGKRVTSAEAYLWPASGRPNLTVRPDTQVATVRVEAGRVVGVDLEDGSQVGAERVVLAAGAIHTPVVLQRSGIDARGVGDGLQDHPSAAFTLQLKDGVAADPSGLAVASLWQGVRPVGARDARVQLLPMNHLGRSPETAGLGLLMLALMNPRSESGTVRCDAGTDRAVVDFALLDDPWDVAAMVDGVQLARQVLAAPSFRDIVETVYVDEFGTQIDALRSDDDVERWLRRHCGDYVHASSSCRMGTVVDASGWVHGVDGLAVCDASIFPSIPEVNTHLPTTMLAERLAARWRAAP